MGKYPLYDLRLKFSLGRDNLEDVLVDRKIILKWILNKYHADWIQLAQDKGQ